MNRLKDFLKDPREPDRQDDYYEVESYHDSFFVSFESAVAIVRWLEQLPLPAWITFRDLTGARHRIPSVHINRISESTAAQRAARRQFYRARRLEDKQDRRPWEDDND